jgi:hypothetical protein
MVNLSVIINRFNRKALPLLPVTTPMVSGIDEISSRSQTSRTV